MVSITDSKQGEAVVRDKSTRAIAESEGQENKKRRVVQETGEGDISRAQVLLRWGIASPLCCVEFSAQISANMFVFVPLAFKGGLVKLPGLGPLMCFLVSFGEEKMDVSQL